MEIEYDYHKERWYIQPFITFWYAWIKGMSLVIDIIAKPVELGGKAECMRRERWTDRPTEDIHGRGYRICRGLHDSITWWGTRMYVRLGNFCEFDIKTAYPEKKDTPQTLNDEMESKSDERFKRGLARAQLGQAADWQKIGLIAVLAVGVIIGTKILGFW